MINVNEILKKHNPDYVLHGANVLHSSQILKSVKEIVEEVLKEAAHKGKATADWHRGKYTGEVYINEQSILDVAKQVKYD